MWNFCKNFGFFILLFSLVLGIGCQSSESSHRSKQLIIGLESSYPPFEFKDVQGKIIGFDVDVGNLIAAKLNKQLVIKEMEFEAILLSLKQGKIDLILSGMNITESRLKEIGLVAYHGNAATSFSLIFWGKIPDGITSLEDIKNHQDGLISVQTGSVTEAYMSNYPTIRLKFFQGALAPLMDVKFGKSTANLVESDVAEYLKQHHPEIAILNVPLKEEEKILGYGIGIKKENIKLFNQVSEVIQELKKSGELRKLETKWFQGDES